MAFEIHPADLEQLQAQGQGELTHDGEGQDQMLEHDEPQTPNEDIPESTEGMQDPTQNTAEGEQSISQIEQPEQEGDNTGENDQTQ